MQPQPSSPTDLATALQHIERLERRVRELERTEADLNLMLSTTVEHGDTIEALLSESNARLTAEIADRERAQAQLQQLLDLISCQKEDLEIIMNTVMEHGDVVDAQWREKFGVTLELANLDALTQCSNRRRFDAYLAEQWLLHAADRRPLAMILVDIDHFKLFNDHYGHLGGDECLRRVGQTLSASLRHAPDLLCRYGGEEFAAILPGTDLDGARISAVRMQESLASLGIPHQPSPISDYVTMSLGIAVIEPARSSPASDASRLVALADEALYEAKRLGRNRVAAAGGAAVMPGSGLAARAVDAMELS